MLSTHVAPVPTLVTLPALRAVDPVVLPVGATVTAERVAPEDAWFVRLFPWLPIAFATVLPLVQLGAVLAFLPAGRDWAVGIAATAIGLPLGLRIVRWALDGRTERRPWVSAIVIVAVTGLAAAELGDAWLPNLTNAAVAILVVAPAPWSFLGAVAVAVSAYPLALAHDVDARYSFYYARAVGWRSFTFFVLLWLAVHVRRLAIARQQIAAAAVVQEQARIEADLQRVVGTELAGLVRAGEQTARMLDDGATDVRVHHALTDLVTDSRSTMTGARRLIAGYRSRAVGEELAAAASLLRAAGVGVRIVDRSGHGDVLDDDGRRDLLAVVEQVLHAGGCSSVLLVAERNGARTVVRTSLLEATDA